MRIGIDARFALGVRRGIGVYSLNLIKNLADIDVDNEYVLYTSMPDFHQELPQNENFKVRCLHPSLYPIWEQFTLPLAAMKDRIDVLHCLGNTAPLLMKHSIKTVLTLHDVSFMKPYSVIPKSPIYYQQLGRIYRNFVAPRAALMASSIISVSKFAAEDIALHIHGIDTNATTVTHLAPHPIFAPVSLESSRKICKERYGFKNQFILTVSGRGPQKNLMFTLKNYLKMRSELLINHDLVIVGLGKGDQRDFRDLAQSYSCTPYVHFLEFVDPEYLLHLYNMATVFVFGSLHESFGLPPLEALACGTPSILSETGALPEISGESAMYFNPKKSSEFRDLLFQVTSNSELRQAMSEKGLDRAKQFSWKNVAFKTIQVYIKVMSQSSQIRHSERRFS